MIELRNDRLCVSISETGAEIKRIVADGRDVLWNGDPAYWTGTAPLLFPICGGLRDDRYTLNGKEYSLEKHGFARCMSFSLERKTAYSVTLLLSDTPETLKQYPWHFELRVTYSLRGACLKVSYDIKNNSDNLMYVSVGSHEAYACPEGIEEYDIIFPQKETLSSCDLEGNLLAHTGTPIIKDTDTLPLYNRFFTVDALIFKELKSRSAYLRCRSTGRMISVDFDGCDYLLLWTKPGANYICIEPWAGIPSMADDGYAIEEKEGMLTVEPSTVLHREHTIHF